MKHVDEYYTCDRCGEKIKYVPNLELFSRLSRKKKTSELKVISAEKDCYEGNFSNIETVSIVEYYRKQEKTLHLCPKCRQDFEKFMRKETV